MKSTMDVKSLLDGHYTKGDDYTHVSLGKYKGKLKYDNIDEFYNKYSKYMWHEDLAIAERPSDYTPFTMDIDFLYAGTQTARQYTKTDIMQVMQIMNRVLKKVGEEDINTIAYALEKEEPTIRTNDVKDGFHIIYPWTAFNKQEKEALYNIFMNEVAKEDSLFANIDAINAITDIFDKKATTTNPWMLYGSRKQNAQSYKATFYYKNDKPYKINKDDNELTKLLSIRKFTKEDRTIKDDSKIAPYYTTKRRSSLDNILIENDIHDMEDVKKLSKEEEDKILKEVRKLLPILSDKSASNYEDWLHVGWILGGISSKLLEDYLLFSQKCPDKYDEKACKRVFFSARKGGQRYTVRTLHFMAKRDNPSKYTTIIENELIRENVNDLSKDINIAETISHLCKNKFIFSTRKPSNWFQFDGRWHRCDSEAEIYRFITRDFKDLLLKISQEYIAKMLKMDHDDIQRKILEENKKNLDIAISKLKNHSFVASVIKASSNFMADSEFEDKLNSNIYLMGFNNGVLDLENNIFRPAMPEDYVSMSVKYDYKDYLNGFDNREENLTEIKQYLLSGPEPKNMGNYVPKFRTALRDIYKYFSQTQPEPKVREYLFNMLASTLDGKANQLFNIWTGAGANGKSTTIEFCKVVFGDYSGTLDPTAITRKQGNSSGARPELANKEGKRFVDIQEPDDDDSIKTGLMKQLVSGDEQEVRKLFGDPKSVVFQLKVFFCCNTLPDISARDDGTWRRIRVLNWPSKFVTVPKAENEFLRDVNMANKLKSAAQAFLFILAEIFYPQYRKHGIKEPETVIAFTEQYKEETNVYYGFIRDMLEQTGKNDNVIALSELTKMFRNWYRDNYNGKCPSQKEIKRYLMDNKYTVKNNNLLGFIFKSCSEEFDFTKDLNVLDKK